MNPNHTRSVLALATRILLVVAGIAIIASLGWLMITKMPAGPSSHPSDQPAITTKRYAPFERQTVVVVILDGSGSFGYFDTCLQMIAPPINGSFVNSGIIGMVTKGCVISVILITDKADPNNVILSATEVAYNEFDPNVKTNCLKGIIGDIQSLKSPQSYGTDIYGALFQATQVFSDAQYDDFDKRLYIFSDLADTEGRNFPIDLSGVEVTVLFFSSDLEPEKANVQKPDKDVWLRQFSNWGAKSANIIEAINSQNASL
ncbi:MAG: hypothetical protein Q7S37_02065 [bacterium]|nr:hypothetical protein [bacterium]